MDEKGSIQMSLIEIARTIRAAWDELFKREPKVDLFVVHLEEEIKYLREQNQILSTKLEVTRLQKDNPAPVVRRDPPKLTQPVKTKWDLYLEQDMARQEREAAEAEKSQVSQTSQEEPQGVV
jgi:hypothetical protein